VVVIGVEPIRERFSTVAPFLDERGRRLVAVAGAFAVGYGGIAAVAMATGLAPSTIGRGLKDWRRTNPRRAFGGPGRDASRRLSRTRHWSKTSRRWSNRRREGIRNRRCGRPARACDDWPRRCSSRATRQAVLWSANCSMPPVAVCKETARPRRATATPTGIRNSPISTPRWPRLFGRKPASGLGRHQEEGTGRRLP